MPYSASETAKKLKLTKDTLRYYEREGLLPPIQKNKSGYRVYFDEDIEWVYLIRCLRDTDMPISKIKQYVSLMITKGGASISERREILLKHELFIKEKTILYQNLLQLIEKKIAFYDNALKSKNPNAVKCMDYKTEWEQFRTSIGEKHE